MPQKLRGFWAKPPATWSPKTKYFVLLLTCIKTVADTLFLFGVNALCELLTVDVNLLEAADVNAVNKFYARFKTCKVHVERIETSASINGAVNASAIDRQHVVLRAKQDVSADRTVVDDIHATGCRRCVNRNGGPGNQAAIDNRSGKANVFNADSCGQATVQ